MFVKVFDGATVDNTTIKSKPVSVPPDASNFSLQWTVTGSSPNVDFGWEESADGITFIYNDDQFIVESINDGTGPQSDGVDMIDFSPQPCNAIKIIAIEDANAEATITATLVMT